MNFDQVQHKEYGCIFSKQMILTEATWLSKEKKDSIKNFLRERSNDSSPGMSAVFSALKDVDGIEQAKSKKKKPKA